MSHDSHMTCYIRLWLIEALLLEGQDANLQQALSISQAVYIFIIEGLYIYI